MTPDPVTLRNSCLGLMFQIARRFASRYRTEPDEFVSAAFAALSAAADRFRADAGTKFSTYAHRCITCQCITHWRFLRGLPRGRPLAREGELKRDRWRGAQRTTFGGGGFERAMYAAEDPAGPPSVPDPSPLGLLQGRERDAMTLRARGFTLAQIGREFDISKEMARLILESARRRVGMGNHERQIAPKLIKAVRGPARHDRGRA